MFLCDHLLELWTHQQVDGVRETEALGRGHDIIGVTICSDLKLGFRKIKDRFPIYAVLIEVCFPDDFHGGNRVQNASEVLESGGEISNVKAMVWLSSYDPLELFAEGWQFRGIHCVKLAG